MKQRCSYNLGSWQKLHCSIIILFLLMLIVFPVLSQDESPEPEPPPIETEILIPTNTEPPPPTETLIPTNTELPPPTETLIPTLEITDIPTETTTLTIPPAITETMPSAPTETLELVLTEALIAEMPDVNEEPVVPFMSEIESFSMMPLSFSDPRTYINSTEAVIAPADSNQIQKAIYAATSSSPYAIYLLEGEYLISTRLLMNNRNIHIYGRGAGVTILRRDTLSSLNLNMIQVAQGTTLTLSHVTIRDGNSTSGVGRGGAIYIHQDDDRYVSRTLKQLHKKD